MDSKTVVIIAIAVHTWLALGMIFAMRTRRVYAGFGLWTAFSVSLPLCYFLLALRGHAPDFVTIILAHALNLCGFVAVQEGTSRFLEQKPDGALKVNIAITAAALAGIGWYTYANPSVSARIVVSSAAQMLLVLHAGLKPHFSKKTLPTAIYLLSFSFVCYGLFAAVRGGRALVNDYQDALREGWTLDAVIIVVMLLVVAAMMGCLLMTSERAINEAREARQSMDNLLANLRGMAYRVQMTPEGDVIEYISEGVVALTGYPLEKFLGKPTSSFLDRINPDDLFASLGELQHSIEEKRRYAVTYRFTDAQGRQRWFWDQGVALKLRGGIPQLREGYITDVTERVEAEAEKARLVGELKQALAEVKTLTGLIPICAACKKIRDDKGYWNSLEIYLAEHTGADFTHGICPDCASRLYPIINTPEKS